VGGERVLGDLGTPPPVTHAHAATDADPASHPYATSHAPAHAAAHAAAHARSG